MAGNIERLQAREAARNVINSKIAKVGWEITYIWYIPIAWGLSNEFETCKDN